MSYELTYPNQFYINRLPSPQPTLHFFQPKKSLFPTLPLVRQTKTMLLTDLPTLGTGFTQTPGPFFTTEDANCYPSDSVPGAQRAYQPL